MGWFVTLDGSAAPEALHQASTAAALRVQRRLDLSCQLDQVQSSAIPRHCPRWRTREGFARTKVCGQGDLKYGDTRL